MSGITSNRTFGALLALGGYAAYQFAPAIGGKNAPLLRTAGIVALGAGGLVLVRSFTSGGRGLVPGLLDAAIGTPDETDLREQTDVRQDKPAGAWWNGPSGQPPAGSTPGEVLRVAMVAPKFGDSVTDNGFFASDYTITLQVTNPHADTFGGDLVFKLLEKHLVGSEAATLLRPITVPGGTTRTLDITLPILSQLKRITGPDVECTIGVQHADRFQVKNQTQWTVRA